MGCALIKSFAFAAIAPALVVGMQSASADDYYRGSLKDGPAIAQGSNWTGFYAGVHAGGAWGNMSVKDINGGVDPGPFDYSPSGAFGGGTAGYNLQLDRIVIGIEGDLGYLDLSGGKTVNYAAPDQNYHKYWSLDGGLYGDITGRVGLLIAPVTLLYGKGGFAFYDGAGIQGTTKPWYKPTGTDTFTGYVVGGGIEHYISSNISIKAEYLHFSFGTADGVQEKQKPSSPVYDDGTAVGYKFYNKQNLDADSIKVGLNYHF